MPTAPARCVLLHHDQPDGSWHYDLMIQRLDPARPAALVAFRVWVRLDTGTLTTFDGVRLGEHRVDYLGYEGALSGDRGTVRHLARGLVLEFSETDESLRVTLDWGLGPTRWTACRLVAGEAPDGEASQGQAVHSTWRFCRQA